MFCGSTSELTTRGVDSMIMKQIRLAELLDLKAAV